jgi:hypothetical protein
MAAIAVTSPTLKITGLIRMPDVGTIPIATGAAAFGAGSLLVLGSGGPPQFSNQSTVAAPATNPSATTATAGGTVAAGVYKFELTYVTLQGESTVGPESAITTTGATSTITFDSPPPLPGVTGFNVYCTAANGASGTEKLQTVPANPANIGGVYTLTAPPTVATSPPGTNTTGGTAPLAPTLTANATASTLPIGTYLVQVSYQYASGESLPSPATSITTTVANPSIGVTAPAAQLGAIGYFVYVTPVGGAAGTETRQGVLTALGTNSVVSSFSIQGCQKGATNLSSGILGIAMFDSNAIYAGPSATSTGFPALTGINSGRFGVPAAVPGVVAPQDQTNMRYYTLHDFNQLDINLPTTVTYPQGGMLGAAIGLSIDSGSGFFVADPSQTNKVGTIVGEVNGPGYGTYGDTAKRVTIQINASAIAF